MGLQYLQDNNGNTTAVVVPIEEWNKLTEKHTGLEELPQWQKKLIDQRLNLVKNHPDELIPLEDFMKELDKDESF
jgi:hypothetical protein